MRLSNVIKLSFFLIVLGFVVRTDLLVILGCLLLLTPVVIGVVRFMGRRPREQPDGGAAYKSVDGRTWLPKGLFRKWSAAEGVIDRGSGVVSLR
ncbi:hypothetical protein [uncultured Pseudonocardia sp.]|uniref:hypothetical protein n=2 Tax=Pseudonocardia TaxID=1847 RepID=UPI002616019A|nr:hypothetical protein [uncultured Pseudonocardia sp.]